MTAVIAVTAVLLNLRKLDHYGPRQFVVYSVHYEKLTQMVAPSLIYYYILLPNSSATATAMLKMALMGPKYAAIPNSWSNCL